MNGVEILVLLIALFLGLGKYQMKNICAEKVLDMCFRMWLSSYWCCKNL